MCSLGAATDGDIEQAMRPLRDLPVWTVVRLCTDDDEVYRMCSLTCIECVLLI